MKEAIQKPGAFVLVFFLVWLLGIFSKDLKVVQLAMPAEWRLGVVVHLHSFMANGQTFATKREPDSPIVAQNSPVNVVMRVELLNYLRWPVIPDLDQVFGLDRNMDFGH
jgi:hypothetical protein